MRLLIIGSGGMLGHVTTLYLRSQGHDVTDISLKQPIDSHTILANVLNTVELEKLFLKPYDAIINCAALLLNASEQHQSDAVLLNAWFPHYLSERFSGTTTTIVQVSSDGIFNGQNAPYFVGDLPNATTFYGKTKILGELNNGKDLTVRASFFGPDLKTTGVGLFNWFVQQQGQVNGYSSVMFNGVTSLEFAKFILHALQEHTIGICHLGGAQRVSKAELLTLIRSKFTLQNIRIQYTEDITKDNTLILHNLPIGYMPKTYDIMLDELREWIMNNLFRYKHYTFND